MGSGTTLITARTWGHEAFGIDSDPLAVLIARASVKDLDADRFARDAEDLLLRAKRLYPEISSAAAYPDHANVETQEFIRYWFDTTSRRQLTAMIRALNSRRYESHAFLKIAISRMIIAKEASVSKAIDISHSRPHIRRDGTPRRPFEVFQRSTNAVVRGASFAKRCGLPKANARKGDCRDLPFGDGEFDCIVTSPPYLNAIDYMRGHKLSLVWFDYNVDQLRAIRSGNIGSERGTKTERLDYVVDAMVQDAASLSSSLLNKLRRYVSDLESSLLEMQRVLRNGGELTLVVGDCTIRGTEVLNSIAVETVAEEIGFAKVGRRSRRALPENRRYLPPPSNRASMGQLQKRMRHETILKFMA